MDIPENEQEILGYLHEIERWTGKTINQQVYEAIEDYVKSMKKEINKNGKSKKRRTEIVVGGAQKWQKKKADAKRKAQRQGIQRRKDRSRKEDTENKTVAVEQRGKEIHKHKEMVQDAVLNARSDL